MKPSRRSSARKTAKQDLSAVREWAAANGHSVSTRGRISATVREAYEAAAKWTPLYSGRPVLPVRAGAATALMADCGEAYRSADDTTRRAYNQAWFEGLYIDQDSPGVITTRPERSEIIEAIQTATVRPIKTGRSRAERSNGRGTPRGTASIRLHRV